MDEGQVDRLVTIVDLTLPWNNVTTRAKSQGFSVEVENKEGDYYITMIARQMAAEATDIRGRCGCFGYQPLFGLGQLMNWVRF